MTCEIIELPLDEAIKLEATQNMERDRRVLGSREVDGQESVYLAEAEHWLTTTGEGYIPDFTDHKHVKVKNWSD